MFVSFHLKGCMVSIVPVLSWWLHITYSHSCKQLQSLLSRRRFFFLFLLVEGEVCACTDCPFKYAIWSDAGFTNKLPFDACMDGHYIIVAGLLGILH